MLANYCEMLASVHRQNARLFRVESVLHAWRYFYHSRLGRELKKDRLTSQVIIYYLLLIIIFNI